jgi:DNA-directed RNA polymerase specialized sigma24 family protein
MSSAAEVFALQLARASGKANKFLHSRGLTRDDRDDVIAAAILWCWENRNNYSLVTTLDTWFVNAVRDAYRAWRRGEMRNGTTEIVENMGSQDDPAYTVMLRDAVKTLSKNMDEVDRAIVALILDGKEQREASIALGIGLTQLKARLRVMRDQLPESAHKNTILRRVVTAPKPDLDATDTWAHVEPSAIDKEIAALDFPPPSGKDCPPCWRCKWFEGYLPGANKPVRMEIVEPDVKAAVANTEAEKIRIANEVRDGTI